MWSRTKSGSRCKVILMAMIEYLVAMNWEIEFFNNILAYQWEWTVPPFYLEYVYMKNNG